MTRLLEFCGFDVGQSRHRMLRFFQNILMGMLFIFGGICAANASFTVGTISVNAGDKVSFTLTPGGTFTINCGSGGTLYYGNGNPINGSFTRTDSDDPLYYCTYSTSGTKTITFSGTATGYTDSGEPAIRFWDGYVASLGGDFSSVFPYLGPDITQHPLFVESFSKHPDLTSLASTLFSGYTTGAESMFAMAFSNTGLTSLPAGLFASFTSGADEMFLMTFHDCPDLSGYIPADTFSGLVSAGTPDYNGFMVDMFAATNLNTSCPNGTTSFSGTDYYEQNYWGVDAVSCVSTSPVTVTYSCGNGTGSVQSTTATYGQNFTPAAANSCTAPTGQIFVGWGVSGTSDIKAAGVQFSWGYVGNKTLTAQYSPFSITTTSLSSNGSFLRFYITAAGTFHVDCGDDGVLRNRYTGDMIPNGTITHNSVVDSRGEYQCEYFRTGGVKTISFSGTATAYSTRGSAAFSIDVTSQSEIAALNGDLSAIFPYIGSGSGEWPLFVDAFIDCTNLTSVSSTLFSGYTVAKQEMFYETFQGCTSLSSLPAGLFTNITSAEQGAFSKTFKGCSGLGGYIPPTFFAGLIQNNAPYATDMMTSIFYGTNLATSCNGYSGTTRYTTPYDSYWDSKVSCISTTPVTVTYNCGSAGGTAPSSSTATYGSSFTPSGIGNCNVPTGQTFIGWKVSGTSDIRPASTAFVWNYAENKTLTAQFSAFNITTDSLSAGDRFGFKLGAAGTFLVDCGSGGTLHDSGDHVLGGTIVHNTAEEQGYYCVYSTAGVKTIRFGGDVTGYSSGDPVISFAENEHVVSLAGNMSAMFPIIGTGNNIQWPRFRGTFYDCDSLTTVPTTLFANYTVAYEDMFSGTFGACDSLTSIQAGLFSNITTAYGDHAFFNTFVGSGLTSIPSGLFAGLTTIDGDSVFSGTFGKLGSLTSLPAGLFANVTSVNGDYIFASTFASDPNLSGFIPPTLFEGLTNAGSPDSGNIMKQIFNNTNLATSCSGNTTQYYTGYEDYFDSKVSCVSTSPVTVTYSCGGSGTAPSSTTAVYGQFFTPAASTCTAPSGQAFLGWKVSGTNDILFAGDAQRWNYASNKTLTAQFGKLMIKTIRADDFQEPLVIELSARGTFTIDCGDGGELMDGGTGLPMASSTFTRSNTVPYPYVCEYPNQGGPKIIKISGTATAYNNKEPAIRIMVKDSITAISGNLPSIFPNLGTDEGETPLFRTSFAGQTTLTYVSSGLFSGYTNMKAEGVFVATFERCGLTSLPSGLFSTITDAAPGMFEGTFAECSNLVGYIPSNMFAGLVANNSPDNEAFMYNMFYNTSLVTTCPAGTAQYITGYESYWDNKKSCIDGYTVTYSCNGGTGTAPSNQTATPNASFTPAANTCTKTGYTFGGWDVSNTNPVQTKPAGTAFTWTYTENKTFSAKWTANPYTVTYSCGTGDGGTAPTTQTSATYDASFTPAANTCTKTGHTFAGWEVSNTGSPATVKPAGTAFTWDYTENKTFTATWTPASYTVTYSCGDGTGGTAPTTNTSATYGSSFTPATNSCTKTGHTFAGWAVSGTSDVISSATTWTYASDKTLTATWTANNYTITYSCGTGTGGSAPTTNTSATYGSSFTPAANSCTKTGYNFAGWEVSNTGSPATVKPAGTAFTWDYTENKTFTATWTLASYTASYSCGAGTGSIANGTATYGQNFTPATNTCTAPTGQTFVGWTIDGTVVSTGSAFAWNYTSNKTLTAQYKAFSIGTTSIAVNGTFTFIMSAIGTFYVDCGEGGVLSGTGVSGKTITRSDTALTTYTCAYSQASSAGTKTIWFGGLATGYYNSEGGSTDRPTIRFANNTKVASVSGNMSAMFPYLGSGYGQAPNFVSTFRECSNLTTIDGTLFSNYTTGRYSMFSTTFANCTGLTSIPSGLFSNITTGASNLFGFTFENCTGLAPTQSNPNPIPSNLFSGITTGQLGMFSNTFAGCTGLTSIPSGLFSNITTAAQGMFFKTFYGCTGLTGYIPKNLFAGLIANNSPTATDMMTDTFDNTGSLATSCSGFTGMHQYITGYEDYWNSHVSCWNTYTITYSCGNGSGNIANGTATYGESFVPAASTCTPPNGSSFAGWAVSNTGTNSDVKAAGTGFTWNYTENKTFTATYSPNTIDVSWYHNGSEITVNAASESCVYGEDLTVPSAPSVPTGHVFVGWRLCSMANLDTSIDMVNSNAFAWISNNGTASGGSTSTYGLTQNGTFVNEFSYGNVYGQSKCSSKVGNSSGDSSNWLATNSELSSYGSGTYCWCRVAKFKAKDSSECLFPESKWVFYYNLANGGYNCATDCAIACSGGVSVESYRVPFYNAAQ